MAAATTNEGMNDHMAVLISFTMVSVFSPTATICHYPLAIKQGCNILVSDVSFGWLAFALSINSTKASKDWPLHPQPLLVKYPTASVCLILPLIMTVIHAYSSKLKTLQTTICIYIDAGSLSDAGGRRPAEGLPAVHTKLL